MASIHYGPESASQVASRLGIRCFDERAARLALAFRRWRGLPAS